MSVSLLDVCLMRTFGISLSVGGFLLLGAGALLYLFSVLGEANISIGQRYLVYADFDNAGGLEPGAIIEIAGVNIGRVDGIQRIEERARVSLSIDSSVEIPDDTIASIKTRGLLGGQYLFLSLGGSDRILQPGGKIRDTESPVDVPGLMAAYVAAQQQAAQADCPSVDNTPEKNMAE